VKSPGETGKRHGFSKLVNVTGFLWLDNWSTMPMVGHGERTANGDVVYYSELPDPSNGKTIEYKSVLSEASGDSSRFVMYEKQQDGSWLKHMEMTATRH
jgi:hypothetical protein